MNYQTIISDLESGKIKIDSDHHTSHFKEKIQYVIESFQNKIKRYREKINAAEGDDKSTYVKLLKFHEDDFYNNFVIGEYINGIDQTCNDCDENLYLIPLDENILTYIPSKQYWETIKIKGDDFKFTLDDIKPCPCKEIKSQKKLVSEILVPSGKLVFDNYFKTKTLYEYKDDNIFHPSICSLLGRHELMQYLATQNVGYGQMSNMSVIIYSNNKDEIIIGADLDNYHDERNYFLENPEELIELDSVWMTKAQKFETLLIEGDFEKLGEISCDVWRWQCIDKYLLNLHEEKEGEDSIIASVMPGKYLIEHYFDFPENGDYLYSTIKLKK